MTQSPSVLYLPPGVIPPAVASGPAPGPSGVPFDRAFFERLLPQAVQMFCSQVECTVPRVELLTIDGTTHFVNAISGVTDSFVALQTSTENHDHTVQVFIPYQTIYRVEIHPESDSKRGHLGFLLGAKQPPAIQAPAAATKPAAHKRKSAATQPS